MRKPKTESQKARATDLRLRKTYNMSLEDYEFLLRVGKGCCWICGRPAGDRRLNVDHDHSWKKVKIETSRFSDGSWRAESLYNGVTYISTGEKRSDAIRVIKRNMLRASVRGLLCYQHNSGLQKFSDNSEWLKAAGEYLDNFKMGRPLI